jgi:RsmE family RNA methyltransferase
VPSRPAIDLLLAMPRPKVLKRLWAQFAALGVGRIILTNAEKVERYYFDTHVLDPQFYTARLIEGLQQARDTLLPEVTIVKQLKPFLEGECFPDIEPEQSESAFRYSQEKRPHGVAKKLIADPSGTQTIFQTLESSCPCRVLMAVGPEGGWTPYELELFEQNGYETVGMGKRILRTDTACIGLISLLAECLNKQR